MRQPCFLYILLGLLQQTASAGLGGVSGSYSFKLLDDSLIVGVGYNLDEALPISSVSVTKSQEMCGSGADSRRSCEGMEWRCTGTATILLPSAAPCVGLTAETSDMLAGIDVNTEVKRLQFRLGQGFLENRLRVLLSPLFMYGTSRRRRVNFSGALPRQGPYPMSVPAISFEQTAVRADWAGSAPRGSTLDGLGFSVSWRSGERGFLHVRLLDARRTWRLWVLGARIPLDAPADVNFSLEQSFQVLRA
ncbi:unnamed protein product [Chrysoparadoxa australica]